jgi:hypothetical protein
MREEKKMRWASTITVFIMMFVSIETLIFGTNANSLIELLGYGIIFLLTCVYLYNCFFCDPHINLNVKVLYLLFANLFAWAINGDFTIKYPYACMIILLAYMVSKKIPLSRFIEVFRTVMAIFAAASLVGVLIHEFAAPLLSYLPITTNVNGYNYYNLFFTLIPQDRLWVYFRSYGVFREPGIFALYLILALIFELFASKDKIKPLNIILYLAALIYTYSTAGYLVTLIVFISFLFKATDDKKQKNLKIILLFLSLCALFVVFNNDFFYNRILSKTETENNSTVSRFAAISLNLSLAFRDPIHFFFGSGYTYVDENYVSIGKELYHSTLHNTNTSLKMMAVYGVGYFSVFIAGLLKFTRKLTKSLLPFLGLIISFLLLLSNEDILLNILLYVFIFYGDQIEEKKEETAPPTNLQET